MSRPATYALLLAAAAISAGCSGSKTRYLVDVNTLKLARMPQLITSKAKTPLKIVLKAKDVPDQVTTRDTSWPIQVQKLRSFVHRDLKEGFEQFFEQVTVVEADPAPGEACVVATVKINDLDTEARGIGMVWVYIGKMNWALALRWNGDEDYLFSYAANVLGDKFGRYGGEEPTMFGSLFEQALSAYFKELVDKKVMDGVRQRERGEQAPAEPKPAAEEKLKI